MSGGIAYVLDPDRVFADKCNMGMVELGPVEGEDIDELKGYIEKHVAATESTVGACVEINQCIGCRQFFTKSFLGDDAAALARSSGEEPASPRHRAGVASMACRVTNAP